MQLGKDVFLALAAVVWADSVVTKEEAEALLTAARASGLEGADLAAIEEATRVRTHLDVLDVTRLGDDEREYVYALATWLANADGVVVDEEREVIRALGDRLVLGADARERAATAAMALDLAPSLGRFAAAVTDEG